MSTLGFGSDDFVNKFIGAPLQRKKPISEMTPKALLDAVEDIKICEECGSDQLIRNPDGYLVCSDCGMTKESIYFVNYNRMVVEDKNRIISANPIYGTKIGEKSERNGKYERLSMKNDRETQSYKVKIRKAAYFELQYIFGALKIPMTFLDEALIVFMKNWEAFKKNSWLRNINGGCAAAAYLIAKQRHFIIDFKSFKEILRCDSKIFTKIILNLGLKSDGLKNTKNAIVKRLIMDESKISLDAQVRRLACYLVDKYPLQLLNTNENIAAVCAISAALHLINGKSRTRTMELSQAFEVATSCITTRINKLFAKIIPNFTSISKSKSEVLKFAGLKHLKASGILPNIQALKHSVSYENRRIDALEIEEIEDSDPFENPEVSNDHTESSSLVELSENIAVENRESTSTVNELHSIQNESLDSIPNQKIHDSKIKQSELKEPETRYIMDAHEISKKSKNIILKPNPINYSNYYYSINRILHGKWIKKRNNKNNMKSKGTLYHDYNFNRFSSDIFNRTVAYSIGYSYNNTISLSSRDLAFKTNHSAVKTMPGWFDYPKDPPWTLAFWYPFSYFSHFLSTYVKMGSSSFKMNNLQI